MVSFSVAVAGAISSSQQSAPKVPCLAHLSRMPLAGADFARIFSLGGCVAASAVD